MIFNKKNTCALRNVYYLLPITLSVYVKNCYTTTSMNRGKYDRIKFAGAQDVGIVINLSEKWRRKERRNVSQLFTIYPENKFIITDSIRFVCPL